jgi:ATP-dependent RNA helicase DOB1
MLVMPLLLTQLEAVSKVRIFVPKDLRAAAKRDSVRRSIEEVKRRFEGAGGLPLLDPLEDLGIEDKVRRTSVRASPCLVLSASLALFSCAFRVPSNPDARACR